MKPSKRQLKCYKLDLLMREKMRGNILIIDEPAKFVSTVLLMDGVFATFDAAKEKELVTQMVSWIEQQFIGVTDITTTTADRTSICRTLNRKLRTLSRRNQRKGIVPAGRTLSNAYIPAKKGDRDARNS